MTYLAVMRPRHAPELQALSSRLMCWKEDVWLVDLSVTTSYWQAQAARSGLSLTNLWRSLLAGLLAEDGAAALAEHPFRALLLARQLSGRRLFGLVSETERVGAGLWRDISWTSFVDVAEEILPHFAARHDARGNAPSFRQKLGLMQRAMLRLGVALPWQLAEMEPLAMRRRFGALFGDIWQWCFGNGAPQDFPWTSFRFETPPRVDRSLEYGINDWQTLEPWLKEDLDRLCAVQTWNAQERLTALNWRLIFDDLTEACLEVRFRHPHGLHKELGRHPTALKQCLYAYEALPRDPTLPAPPLVAWQLEATERLTPSAANRSLFGEADERDEALVELENKLRVPLLSYAPRQDWVPEDSQVFAVGKQAQDAAPSPEAEASLDALAATRPLFLYGKPQAFDPKREAYELRFLERTMSKWWHQGGAGKTEPSRDYYRATDAQQRSYWVFRDTAGKWFLHGVFA